MHPVLRYSMEHIFGLKAFVLGALTSGQRHRVLSAVNSRHMKIGVTIQIMPRMNTRERPTSCLTKPNPAFLRTASGVL